MADPIDGVNNIMTENTCCQTAKVCAGETLEALYSVYWADSFDAALLESKLTEMIRGFTRNARRLTAVHPNPEVSESINTGAIAHQQISVTIASSQPSNDNPAEEKVRTASESTDFPLIDLRDRPAPDVLRLLAVGSPRVVNSCVMTLFRLGYARPEEWSQPLPTVNPGEVMRILTKRVTLTD